MSKTGKLECPALGPFRVLKTDERTVVIQRNQDVERINADRIPYAPPLEIAPPPEPFAPTSNDIDKNAEGPTYVADRLLEHRVTPDGTLYFRVKWYGYTKQTWEPRRNIPEELISRDFAQKRRISKTMQPTRRDNHERTTPRDVHSLSGGAEHGRYLRAKPTNFEISSPTSYASEPLHQTPDIMTIGPGSEAHSGYDKTTIRLSPSP